MRKRSIKYALWLNEKEAERFNSIVNKSGLPREVYLRHLINGLVPTDLPPPSYHSMMNELRGIGNNIKQIAQKAHELGIVDSQKYDEAYAGYKAALTTITEAVLLPRKVEIWRPPQSGR
jgi:hypothetical protein